MKALKLLLPFLAAILLLPALAGVPIPLGDILLVPQSGGSGVLWLDPETGVARVGQANAMGQLEWSEPFDTGLAPVSDATGDVEVDGSPAWALTSDTANAVTLVTADGLIPSLQTLGATGVGPNLLASPGNGLVLVHTENGAPTPTDAQLLDNLLDTPPEILHTAALTNNPLQLLSLPGTPTAMLISQAGNQRQLIGLTESGSTLILSPSTNVGGLMRMQTGVADTNGAPIVFLWTPGGAHVLGTYLWNGAGLVVRTAPLSFSPGAVLPVDPVTVAVVSNDGTQMILAEVDADGNLMNVETFSAAPGERLFGLFRPGFSNRVILSGDTAATRPETFHFQELSGTVWVNTSSATAPELPLPGDLGTNVFFFASDPFVTPGASLLGGVSFADWSAKTNPLDALPATLNLEEYIDETSGLGNLQTQVTPAPGGSAFALANQYRPSLSIALVEGQTAVRRPALGVSPASGIYNRTVEVSVTYDSRRAEAWVRFGAGSAWTPLPDQILVAYDTEISVYARDTVTGLSSPILKRNYVIDPAELQDNDANGDGLPDFVRQAYGLDPLGPNDSSGNGISDFIEILLGHDPLDPLDAPDPEDIPPYFSGHGLVMLGTALAPTGAAFDYGHTLTARRVDNRLLARGVSMSGAVDTDADGVPDVEEILFGTDPEDPDSVNPNGSVAPAFYAALDRVAPLRGAQTVPANNGLVLHSATGFDVNNGDPLGREVVALLVPPEPRRPEVPAIPITGDLQADAEAWRLAALNAYATFRPEPDLVELTPESTLRAVAVEAMLWNVLNTLDPAETPAQNAFTAFPWRVPDTARVRVTTVRLQSLALNGLPLRSLIEGVDGYFEDNPLPALAAATDAIYVDHMTNGVGDARPLPLDTLRRFFSLTPDPAALEDDLEDILTASQIGNALAEAAAVLGIAPTLQRPTGTWTLVMGAHDPLAPNRYERIDAVEVELFHGSGRPFRIDQGMGLAPGTAFEVFGFTDLTGPDGHPGLEVISLAFSAIPLASNNDADGNLLDDEWEKFYFGATGLDPFAIPGGKSHTLLQFFLEGLDPRGPLDPVGPALPAAMPAIAFATVGPGGGTLVFPWPAGYDDQLTYVVETTNDLMLGFSPDPTLTAVRVGNEIHVNFPPAATPAQFYRLAIKLTVE